MVIVSKNVINTGLIHNVPPTHTKTCKGKVALTAGLDWRECRVAEKQEKMMGWCFGIKAGTVSTRGFPLINLFNHPSINSVAYPAMRPDFLHFL